MAQDYTSLVKLRNALAAVSDDLLNLADTAEELDALEEEIEESGGFPGKNLDEFIRAYALHLREKLVEKGMP